MFFSRDRRHILQEIRLTASQQPCTTYFCLFCFSSPASVELLRLFYQCISFGKLSLSASINIANGHMRYRNGHHHHSGQTNYRSWRRHAQSRPHDTWANFEPNWPYILFEFLSAYFAAPQGEAWDFWCLPPVWNPRAVSLIPFFLYLPFCSSAYSPVALSVLSCSAFGPFSWLLFL